MSDLQQLASVRISPYHGFCEVQVTLYDHGGNRIQRITRAAEFPNKTINLRNSLSRMFKLANIPKSVAMQMEAQILNIFNDNGWRVMDLPRKEDRGLLKVFKRIGLVHYAD